MNKKTLSVILSTYGALWIGFCLFESIIAAVGFYASFVNAKIATHRMIQRASMIFYYFYAIMILLVVGLLALIALTISL